MLPQSCSILLRKGNGQHVIGTALEGEGHLGRVNGDFRHVSGESQRWVQQFRVSGLKGT